MNRSSTVIVSSDLNLDMVANATIVDHWLNAFLKILNAFVQKEHKKGENVSP